MPNVRRVFVVDDDESARRGLARLLRAAGHDVCAFASADEFLDAVQPEVSGCVLLDLLMPGLSGEELQAELKTRHIDMPVIVIAANDEPEIRRQAHAMNAAGFFRKPVDGTALLDAIAWALRTASTRGNDVGRTSGNEL
jgi:FixJ family two-component response regulator